MTTIDPRIARIRAARVATAAALAAEEAAIRDAVDAGLTPAAVARDGLGTESRGRVYAILGRTAEGTQPTKPALTPTVYLRGAGVDQDTWARVERAMWARGWATVRDRTTAWHLARGGTPMAFVDFSTGRQAEIDLDGHRAVQVVRVRARYQSTHTVGMLSTVLPTATVDSLVRAVPAAREWFSVSVEVESQEMDLKAVVGGLRPWPYRSTEAGRVLDEQTLARWVADVLLDDG